MNGQVAEDYDELEEGLKKAVIAERDTRGRVVGFTLPQDTKESGVAVWSLLLGYRQFAAPPKLTETHEVIEEDANGRYRALYLPATQLGAPEFPA